ncbi:MAG: hypothetical protein J4473_00920 [Candidatus Aenigmarchaeota archaeon]|nr:hypothetical protein [Candidatus Aenigmarchaeota archaeon]
MTYRKQLTIEEKADYASALVLLDTNRTISEGKKMGYAATDLVENGSDTLWSNKLIDMDESMSYAFGIEDLENVSRNVKELSHYYLECINDRHKRVMKLRGKQLDDGSLFKSLTPLAFREYINF